MRVREVMMRVVLSLERRRLMIFSEFIGGPEGCRRQSEGSGSLCQVTMLEAVSLRRPGCLVPLYSSTEGDATGYHMELS
jgi:hypothetical protein